MLLLEMITSAAATVGRGQDHHVWTEPLYLSRLTKANLEQELDIKAMKVNISPNCMLLKAQPGVCRRSRGKPVKASAPI